MAIDKITDFAKDWMLQIELGAKAKKKYSTLDKWADYRKQYRGDFGNEKIFLNLTYSIGKSLIPRTYFKVPRVAVTPGRPEFAAHARVVEALDNWLIREVALKLALKRTAYDSYCCGTGILKLGYDSEFGFLPEKADEADDFASVTQQSTKNARFIEYNNSIKPGMPWALRIAPEDVITPFGYDDPNALPWVDFMHLRPLKDVKEDFKYNGNKMKLTGGYIPRLLKDGLIIHRSSDLYSKSEPYVLLHEVRDASRRRMYVFAEDKLLLDIEDPLQLEGLPVEFIRFNEDMEYFWGISDIQVLQPQQTEVNEVKKQISKMRRFNMLKFLYQKGALSPDQLNILLSDDIDDVGAGVEVNAESLQMAVLPLVPHSLTAELEKDKQMILSDSKTTIGLSSNSQGEYIPMTSKTATEANMVDAGVSVRIDDRRDHMADVLTNVIRKFNQYIFKYWTTNKVIEVTGQEGARSWVKYTGDQLKGEYHLNIDPEAGQPVSRELKYKMAKELFMELRNDPLINQEALRRQLLRQYDWLDPEASLLIQPAQQGPPMGADMPGAEPPQQALGNPSVIDFEQFAKGRR